MIEVLPASAGMILIATLLGVIAVGAPRIRGDDPLYVAGCPRSALCSPHPRG